MNKYSLVQFKSLNSTFAYYASFIILGATVALTGPALPWLAQHTASRLDQISIIFAASSLGYMVGSLFGGRAYDHFPGHRIQALALLLISVGIAQVPILHSLWFLVAVIFVLGMVQGALDTGCNILLTWTHGDKVGPFMNGLHFFYGVGAFIAPLIFAQVIGAFNDIRWVYWLFSLLALPIAAWFWLLPNPQIREQVNPGAKKRSFNGLFLLIILFFVFHVGLELGFGNWVYTFSTRLYLFSETNAAYLTSAFWGSFTIARLMGIGISTRFRPKTILVADMTGCLSALAILLLWPASSAALWVGTIVMGISIASVFATGMAFADQWLNLTGAMTGWILVGSGIGGMVSPWLIGQLFDRIGPRITMPILLVDNVLAFGILLILILPSRKKETAK